MTALRELQEETGIRGARLVSEEIFSLEILTVNGHMKKGVYVPGHLHFNVTYLAEADENESLQIKADENSGVKWVNIEDAISLTNETKMKPIYKKLNDKVFELR